MARPRDDLLQAPGRWPEQRPQRGDPKLAPVDRLERFPGRLAQLGERRLDKAAALVIQPGNTVQTSRFPSDSFAKVCHRCAIGHHTSEALPRNERAALQDR